MLFIPSQTNHEASGPMERDSAQLRKYLSGSTDISTAILV